VRRARLFPNSTSYFGILVVMRSLQAKEELLIDQRSGSERAETKATGADGAYGAFVVPVFKRQRSAQFQFNVNAKACLQAYVKLTFTEKYHRTLRAP
jgi:hypothetical protein